MNKSTAKQSIVIYIATTLLMMLYNTIVRNISLEISIVCLLISILILLGLIACIIINIKE